MAKVKTDLTMKGAAMAVPTLSGLSIPSTQRAAITPTVGKTLSIAVHQVPVRPPRPTEALVKISHTGLCRSDASFSTGPSPGFPQHDHIAGHEAIGAVVQSHDPSLLGRVVGIRYLGATCGSCAYCARGLPTSCPAQLNIPKHVAGTFQEYATLPTSSLVPLPQYESILDEAAASTATTTTTTAALCAALCSGSAALTALRAAGIVDVAAAAAAAGGKVVVVVSGVGGAIGHLAGAMARRVFGARVVGIDVGPKCDALRATAGLDQLGHYADVLLDAPPREATGDQAWTDFAGELGKACAALRGDDQETPRMVDAVVVCAGEPDAFRNLDGYVCDGGRIVCVGVPKDLLVSIPIHALVERSLRLTGTLMGDHCAALEVMGYISTGLIRPLVTEVSLEDIPGQMQRMVDCQSVGKVVARIRGTSPGPTASVE